MKHVVKNIAFVSVFFFISLLVGCNSTVSKNQELISVEQLMSERPDSALVILQSIDTLSLKSSADKALYSLLYVQALDKNYIDTQDDTQIQIAVNFYKESEDDYHKMLSYYYLARIYENSKEYSSAITSLLKAEKIAVASENNLYLGLIYRSFSDIYNNIYNNVESLNYAHKAYDHFKKSGTDTYSDWALWDIGRAYHNCHKYELSIHTANEVINLGHLKRNKDLIIDGLRLVGMSYFANNQFNEAIKTYNTILDEYPNQVSSDDYRNLGLSYLGIGEIDTAEQCLSVISQYDTTQQWLPYEISKHLGNYEYALKALEEEHRFQDKILRTVISQNVTAAVSNYWDYEQVVQEKDLQHERNTKIIAIFVLATIIILVSIIMSLILKSKNKEIEANMLLASNLKNMLQAKENETQNLQHSYDERIESKELENLSMQNAINTLFEQRFATIDRLSSAYYEYQGTVNEKHKIYTDVMNLVSGLGTDKKTLKELEGFVNTYRNNLMIRFRETFPEMKESDCILYLYSVAGFSSRAISIFINEKLEVVYNRKSRLKQKINRRLTQENNIFTQFL
ncbi:MAG: tetratricopeptide repeat protein [Prevotella sp.]|nr:tetratricopeptide repeat protein [Prevotella sp.]